MSLINVRSSTTLTQKKLTDLKVSPEVVDGDVPLVVAIKILESLDVHVDLVLGEVDGDVRCSTAQI